MALVFYGGNICPGDEDSPVKVFKGGKWYEPTAEELQRAPCDPTDQSAAQVVEVDSDIFIAKAAEDIQGHKAVAFNDAGRLVKADRTASTGYTLSGITTQAVTSGSDVIVQRFGVLAWPSAIFTIGQPVFLGTMGGVLTAAPNTGLVRQVGVATSTDSIQVGIGPVYILG